MTLYEVKESCMMSGPGLWFLCEHLSNTYVLVSSIE